MLNPLSIAHLGIARRPIVAALLGIWDELMRELANLDHGGSGGEPIKKRKRSLERPARTIFDERDILEMLSMLTISGVLNG